MEQERGQSQKKSMTLNILKDVQKQLKNFQDRIIEMQEQQKKFCEAEVNNQQRQQVIIETLTVVQQRQQVIIETLTVVQQRQQVFIERVIKKTEIDSERLQQQQNTTNTQAEINKSSKIL